MDTGSRIDLPPVGNEIMPHSQQEPYKRTTGRRSHRKSRHGCQQCKARKVKCDETKPACKNCIRHAVDCSFSPIANASPSHTSSPQTSESYRGSGPSSQLSSIRLNSEGTLSDLNISDLELLHHYTTTTSYTLGQHPISQSVWRVEAPKIGFSNPYVLRAILAFSALHLSYLRPEQKTHYLAKAEYHHDIALRKVTPIMTTLIEDSSEAFFLFSALTCCIACGKPRKPGDFLLVENGNLAQWLVLVRAIRTITESSIESLRASPLAPIIIMGQRRVNRHAANPVDKKTYIEELEAFIKEEVSDPVQLNIYLGTVGDLERSFVVVYDGVKFSNSADVLMWLLHVSDEYLALLQHQQPIALVIFAYYCVIVRRLEWVWWLQGLSSHIISTIYRMLTEVCQSWIQWPMEQIGWAP